MLINKKSNKKTKKKMSKEKVFPKMVSNRRFEEYKRVAHLIVNAYKISIYPILFRFRVWDDEHIRKYLGCTSTEEIYLDAMRENKERMLFLEQEAAFNEEDFWKIIRDESSPVKSPKEEGFVFVKLPKHDYENRDIIIKSLFVENKQIHINEDFLEEESIIHPSNRQKELYNIVSNFCDEMDKAGFSRENIDAVLYTTTKGKMVPNVRGILHILSCYAIKRK